jgi:hypothetical protein
VLDSEQRLLGVCSFRELFAASAERLVRDVMHDEPVAVAEEMDQEAVARLIKRHGFLALPVVDADGRMKGIVTLDDIVDVVAALVADPAVSGLFNLGTGKARTQVRETRIIDLATASAVELATTVRTLYTEESRPRLGADTAETLITPDTGGNRLILVGDTNELAVVEGIIKNLDRSSAQSSTARVFKVKTADPDKVAEILGASLVRYDAYGRAQRRAQRCARLGSCPLLRIVGRRGRADVRTAPAGLALSAVRGRWHSCFRFLFGNSDAQDCAARDDAPEQRARAGAADGGGGNGSRAFGRRRQR